ncbi:MAG: homogentisate 1,2-dioxygenase [uncultured Acidilobus sp. JCHS]|jgi:hypothetical protein|nr:MAG: homogentisate 1,2-dioxygenase [uncultured Acidilobus sp. JCHS]
MGGTSPPLGGGQISQKASPFRAGRRSEVFYGQGISVEVSRRRQGLPFMHRNMDADELIIRVSGWAKWETETGNFEVRARDAILIPRGIAHRPAEVNDDYLAVELKVSSTKLMPRTS